MDSESVATIDELSDNNNKKGKTKVSCSTFIFFYEK